LSVKNQFPRNSGGISAEPNRETWAARKKQNRDNNSMIKDTQTVANNSARRRMRKKPVIRERNGMRVVIRHETPRDGRKAWRLEWVENGKDCAEMFDTLDMAITHADAKLNHLASGVRTFTKVEFDAIFAFKARIEQFEMRLVPIGRTLDQVISDVVAAWGILPWKAASMAQFILENHGVMNPMLVEQVGSGYLGHLESGYKRKYSKRFVTTAKKWVRNFNSAFVGRYINDIKPAEVLTWMNGLRVTPGPQSDLSLIDKNGLVPASPKTKANVYNYLDQMFKHAKNVLQALPPMLKTAVELLGTPQFTKAEPEAYTPTELRQLFQLCPDQECVLWVALQAFSGLRPCEASALHVESMKRAENHILVNDDIAKKDATNGFRMRKAPITAPLAALLDAIELPKAGRVFRSKAMAGRVMRAARLGGFVWKHDGLRHSFVSYRLRALKDRAEVAYEAGHDIEKQIRHYEVLVAEADVPEWWAFRLDIAGLPYTVNCQIVGTKLSRAHKRARQSQGQAELPMAA
jgi:integrase